MMQDLQQFFAALHFTEVQDHVYNSAQLGSHIYPITQSNFNLEEADIVLLGCGENRGEEGGPDISNGPDAIREQLYPMYAWHPLLRIADAGNLLQGDTVEDTYAALCTVLAELQAAGKKVIVLGGSHDLTLQQYKAFAKNEQLINAVVVDQLIDLDETEVMNDKSYLLDMLTAQPNYVKHFTHLGFQSYYTPPRMLETLDKLRFDCIRLGKLREHLEEAEPAMRSASLLSIDVKAIKYSDAPSNKEGGSPNGFAGDEICALMRYAGMSAYMSSVGIYGYHPEEDEHNMTAKQLAQMIWYYIEGLALSQHEDDIAHPEKFKQFNVRFTSNDTLFLKSHKTNRWWMQLPSGHFVPCSYNDYRMACEDEIPERWLREQERMV